MFSAQTITRNKVFVIFNAVVIALAFFLQLWLYPHKAEAATVDFSMASIRYDRMQASGLATNVQILVKPSQAESSGGQLVIHFGSAGVASGACTVNTSSPTLGQSATALPTSGTFGCWGSGPYVYITNVGALTGGTLYGINITAGVTTGAAGTTTDDVNASTSAGTSRELTYVGSDFITNDLVTVTATVAATFTMALSANQDTFTTNLAPGGTSVTSGVNATFVTNATNGWNAYVKDANTGLHSTRASNTIASTNNCPGSTTAISAGSDGYNLWAASGGGSPTIATCYAGDSTHGGGLTTAYQPFASNTAPTSGDVVTFKEIAAVAATTKAASDYSDVIQVVGAGNF